LSQSQQIEGGDECTKLAAAAASNFQKSNTYTGHHHHHHHQNKNKKRIHFIIFPLKLVTKIVQKKNYSRNQKSLVVECEIKMN